MRALLSITRSTNLHRSRFHPSLPTKYRSNISTSRSLSASSLNKPSTLVTTLPSGLRVASEENSGHFAAVGVCVDAGCRYESEDLLGASHFVDRMAFKSTQQTSASDLGNLITKLGGNISCSSSREAIMYQSAIFHPDIPSVLSIFAETILSPAILENEISQVRDTIKYEFFEVQDKPELFLPEVVHAIAYDMKTLGNPIFCDPNKADQIGVETVRKYLEKFYRPERMVIAGAGVKHDLLVELADKFFERPLAKLGLSSSDLGRSSPSSLGTKLSSSSQPSLTASPRHLSSPSQSLSTTAAQSVQHIASPTTSPRLPSPPANYQGGTLILPTPRPPQTSAIPEIPKTHIYLCFPSVPYTSPDIYPLSILQVLMGGGDSFSAGGPGKGMYSRLYTQVLNRYHWIHSCIAFNNSYSDSGLFGISASCEPKYNSLVLEVIVNEFAHMAEYISEEEMNRAKNQLKSSLLMNLESRMVQLEDIARQVQVLGKRSEFEEMIQKIENVTKEDLSRVAKMIVYNDTTPTLVVSGENVKGVQELEGVLEKYGVSHKRKKRGLFNW
ncbi:peptidase M16 inactive domain-containing protein [Paraphysoderma sedebokerense]|nr:peptidase M16 inactive domain-containing protein [Paraphysoderma sedebokerense]